MEKQYKFAKFLLASGLAAIVNVLTRIGVSQFVTYEIAVVLAYIIGMLTAYLLTKKFVFDVSGNSVKREIAGFVFVNMIALVQVWIVSVSLYRWGFPFIGWTYRVALFAHLVGVASPAFTSYFGHKYISFGKVWPKQ